MQGIAGDKVKLEKVKLGYITKPNINALILRTKVAVLTKIQALFLFSLAIKLSYFTINYLKLGVTSHSIFSNFF